MKRIHVLDKKGIIELIPNQWLLKEYGGGCQITLEETFKQFESDDKL